MCVMQFQLRYPTAEHRSVVEKVVSGLSGEAGVRALLLTCSCATGQAVAESCVDIAVLLDESARGEREEELTRILEDDLEYQTLTKAMLQHGQFAHVDLGFIHAGQFDARYHHHGWCSGPDEFEVEIGNYLAYSQVLWEGDDGVMGELRGRFLPYYAEALREQRLGEVTKFCRNNLEHVAPFVRRAQYFQAHRRLLNAMGEYLQALFIARRVYPICYDKWIRFQLDTILGRPDIYRQLVELLEVKHLESDELSVKAGRLLYMLEDALKW